MEVDTEEAWQELGKMEILASQSVEPVGMEWTECNTLTSPVLELQNMVNLKRGRSPKEVPDEPFLNRLEQKFISYKDSFFCEIFYFPTIITYNVLYTDRTVFPHIPFRLVSNYPPSCH